MATLTLRGPVGAVSLASLADAGLVIHTVEALGSDASGQTISAGAPFSRSVMDELSIFASEVFVGASLQGVVAVEGHVPNEVALNRLVAHPDVFLVDVSAELAQRAARLAEAPSLNDLYWYLAGWEPVE